MIENLHLIQDKYGHLSAAHLAALAAEMKLALTSLGFDVSGAGDRVTVVPPSWRADVGGKADLVEEIVRIAGLDRGSVDELQRLRVEVAQLRAERDKSQAVANSAQSLLTAEKTVQDKLVLQLKQAEAEARARQARQPIPIPFTGIGRIGSGDNRSPEQRRNDKAWWENYHRCGSGKC